MENLASIEGIYIYPIKSCAGISIDKAVVTKYGLAAAENPKVIDRKWMIIDENNSFISQRTVPKMVLIKIRIDGDYLVLSAPNSNDIKVSVDAPKNKRECKCKDHMVFGNIYGGEISHWLTEVLGAKYDLACFDEKEFEARKLINMKKNNQINLKDTDETIYSDYSQIMLLSDSSLKDLNTKTPFHISFWNFRPNIVVKDCEKYSEDDWMFIKINESTFRKTRHCTRCLLTTVDPESGVKDPNQEPLKTLKTYRLVESYGLSPLLGINLVTDFVKDGQTISINDKIYDNKQ